MSILLFEGMFDLGNLQSGIFVIHFWYANTVFVAHKAAVVFINTQMNLTVAVSDTNLLT